MTPPPVARLAIYDLDRTITSLPTWTPFLLYAAWTLAPWRLVLVPLVLLAALIRTFDVHDRDWLKTVMHRLLLGQRLTATKADRVASGFADHVVRRHLRPGALAQMAHDRRDGCRIVIATAAHRFYARAIADRLDVADLVATRARRDADNAILPGFDGPNCYGRDKQAMLAAWLRQEGHDRAAVHLRFYSDHFSDQPSFDWADQAVAVNPDARLRALSVQNGWRIVDWRAADDQRL